MDPLATVVNSQTADHEGDFLGFNDLFMNVVILCSRKLHSKACNVQGLWYSQCRTSVI